MSEVAILGTGYVGSVTGACLAEAGNTVTMVDVREAPIKAIQEGRSPIVEPGLDEIIRTTAENGTLRATMDLGTAVTRADVILLALPTPPRDDGSANMDYVYGAVYDLAPHLHEGALVVTRSTVPVGTTDQVQQILNTESDKAVHAVSNPEFLAEGSAVADTQRPSRIVVGAHNEAAFSRMRELWHPFLLSGENVIEMDPRSAELTKLAANTYLAGQISLTNVMAEIAEQAGADWRLIQQGVNRDPRIGQFTHPGLGYGGACFPKDVLNLADVGKQLGVDTSFLTSVSETNEHMKKRFAKKIIDYFGDSRRDKIVALWGLAFKAKTDDVRESPALTVIRELTQHGVQVVAHDPEAMENVRALDEFRHNPLLSFADDQYQAAKGADALAIATEWSAFRSPDLARLSEDMRQKVVFDGRSLWDLDTVRRAGFYYDSVGRQVVKSA